MVFASFWGLKTRYLADYRLGQRRGSFLIIPIGDDNLLRKLVFNEHKNPSADIAALLGSASHCADGFFERPINAAWYGATLAANEIDGLDENFKARGRVRF